MHASVCHQLIFIRYIFLTMLKDRVRRDIPITLGMLPGCSTPIALKVVVIHGQVERFDNATPLRLCARQGNPSSRESRARVQKGADRVSVRAADRLLIPRLEPVK